MLAYAPRPAAHIVARGFGDLLSETVEDGVSIGWI